jgi:hypothetical protein
LAEEAEERRKRGEGLQAPEIGQGKAGPGRGKKTGDDSTSFQRGSTSASYLTARIARDRPDVRVS